MSITISGTEVNICEKISIPQIIQDISDSAYRYGRLDDPFYVCDIGDVTSKHQLWVERMPRVKPFYAVKCNPSRVVIKILSKLGVNFDCASKKEISLVMEEGVSPDRIIYAHPCKPISHIKFAQACGVELMTFDSRAELGKIYQHYPQARLVLRIFVGAAQARCPLGLKFGANVEDVEELLKLASELQLNVVGVSFHVGSGVFEASAYETAISLAKHVFDVAEFLGNPLSLLDIGGGFPGNLDVESNKKLFDDVCNTINGCINRYFSDERIMVIAEPGRFYVSSAFHLACTVISRRLGSKLPNSDGNETYHYFLNDGLYGSFNCVVFDHYIGEHYLLNDYLTNIALPDEQYLSVFWGPTCDSADKIMEINLLRRLTIGEKIVFKNMGAYTRAGASQFNGFVLPYIMYYVTSSTWSSLSEILGENTQRASENLQVDDDSHSNPYAPDNSKEY